MMRTISTCLIIALLGCSADDTMPDDTSPAEGGNDGSGGAGVVSFGTGAESPSPHGAITVPDDGGFSVVGLNGEHLVDGVAVTVVHDGQVSETVSDDNGLARFVDVDPTTVDAVWLYKPGFQLVGDLADGQERVAGYRMYRLSDNVPPNHIEITGSASGMIDNTHDLLLFTVGEGPFFGDFVQGQMYSFFAPPDQTFAFAAIEALPAVIDNQTLSRPVFAGTWTDNVVLDLDFAATPTLVEVSGEMTDIDPALIAGADYAAVSVRDKEGSPIGVATASTPTATGFIFSTAYVDVPVQKDTLYLLVGPDWATRAVLSGLPAPTAAPLLVAPPTLPPSVRVG